MLPCVICSVFGKNTCSAFMNGAARGAFALLGLIWQEDHLYRDTLKTWQAIGTIAVVALALGLALVVPASTGTTTTATTSSAASAGSTGANGLLLGFSVNVTSISQGQHFGMTISEFNTLSRTNNVSEASAWVVQGSTQACPDGFYPFGVSVFQGHYAENNVTMVTPLQIFPITPCPMFVRLITGYVFQPLSLNASVLPGSSNQTTAMQALVTVGTNYTGFPGQGQPLPAGAYTLVASDEWGNLAFLYVSVQ